MPIITAIINTTGAAPPIPRNIYENVHYLLILLLLYSFMPIITAIINTTGAAPPIPRNIYEKVSTDRPIEHKRYYICGSHPPTGPISFYGHSVAELSE